MADKNQIGVQLLYTEPKNRELVVETVRNSTNATSFINGDSVVVAPLNTPASSTLEDSLEILTTEDSDDDVLVKVVLVDIEAQKLLPLPENINQQIMNEMHNDSNEYVLEDINSLADIIKKINTDGDKTPSSGRTGKLLRRRNRSKKQEDFKLVESPVSETEAESKETTPVQEPARTAVAEVENSDETPDTSTEEKSNADVLADIFGTAVSGEAQPETTPETQAETVAQPDPEPEQTPQSEPEEASEENVESAEATEIKETKPLDHIPEVQDIWLQRAVDLIEKDKNLQSFPNLNEGTQRLVGYDIIRVQDDLKSEFSQLAHKVADDLRDNYNKHLALSQENVVKPATEQSRQTIASMEDDYKAKIAEEEQRVRDEYTRTKKEILDAKLRELELAYEKDNQSALQDKIAQVTKERETELAGKKQAEEENLQDYIHENTEEYALKQAMEYDVSSVVQSYNEKLAEKVQEVQKESEKITNDYRDEINMLESKNRQSDKRIADLNDEITRLKELRQETIANEVSTKVREAKDALLQPQAEAKSKIVDLMQQIDDLNKEKRENQERLTRLLDEIEHLKEAKAVASPETSLAVTPSASVPAVVQQPASQPQKSSSALKYGMIILASAVAVIGGFVVGTMGHSNNNTATPAQATQSASSSLSSSSQSSNNSKGQKVKVELNDGSHKVVEVTKIDDTHGTYIDDNGKEQVIAFKS